AGWGEGAEVLGTARCRRVFKYHNVTPEHFFEGVDQEYVLSCRAGRRQMPELVRLGLDRYLADSEYNLSELHAEGAAGGAVVAPADALGLKDAVVFTGGASDEELKAYYRTASVFAITSRHEGFCVPVVEAMALEVPVIALGTTAVPGTVGGAGLVWDESEA